MIFSIYIYFTSFIYLFIFFAFAIGDLYDFLGRAVSAETTHHQPDSHVASTRFQGVVLIERPNRNKFSACLSLLSRVL